MWNYTWEAPSLNGRLKYTVFLSMAFLREGPAILRSRLMICSQHEYADKSSGGPIHYGTCSYEMCRQSRVSWCVNHRRHGDDKLSGYQSRINESRHSNWCCDCAVSFRPVKTSNAKHIEASLCEVSSCQAAHYRICAGVRNTTPAFSATVTACAVNPFRPTTIALSAS